MSTQPKLRAKKRSTTLDAAALWEHAALHTPAALRKRAALRSAPRVLAALDLWWTTAQSSMRRSGRTDDGAISETEYVMISCRIYRAIIKPYDQEEAVANAKREWLDDVRHGELSALPEEAFKDAMFELCDLWTSGIDEQSYSQWLLDLFGRITNGTPPNACLWLPSSEIEHGGYDRPVKRRPWRPAGAASSLVQCRIRRVASVADMSHLEPPPLRALATPSTKPWRPPSCPTHLGAPRRASVGESNLEGPRPSSRPAIQSTPWWPPGVGSTRRVDVLRLDDNGVAVESRRHDASPSAFDAAAAVSATPRSPLRSGRPAALLSLDEPRTRRPSSSPPKLGGGGARPSMVDAARDARFTRSISTPSLLPPSTAPSPSQMPSRWPGAAAWDRRPATGAAGQQGGRGGLGGADDAAGALSRSCSVVALPPRQGSLPSLQQPKGRLFEPPGLPPRQPLGRIVPNGRPHGATTLASAARSRKLAVARVQRALASEAREELQRDTRPAWDVVLGPKGG